MIRRMFLLMVLFFSLITLSYPDHALALWAKTFGTSWNEYGTFGPASGGGYYVMSQSADTSGTGKKYLILSRLNASGGVQWSKKIYLEDYDSLGAMELADGKFLITGMTQTNQTAPTDALWAKFNVNVSNGTFTPIFQKAYKGSGDDSLGFGIWEDGDIKIGTGATNSFSGNPDDDDMMIVKINSSNGNIEWSKVFHHSIKDQAPSLIEVSDGYILCSNVANSDYSRQDILVAKLNSTGNVQWAKLFGGTGVNSATIREISGGNFLLIGTAKANKDTYYTDTILIKINGSGNVVWGKRYAGNGAEAPDPYDIEENTDGSFILNGVIMNTTNFRWHPFVMKLTSTGDIQWKKRFTIGDTDTVSFIKRSDGTYLLSGATMTYSPLDSGNIVYGKFDSNFNKIWLKTFGGTGFETGGFYEASGQFFLSGGTTSFGVGAAGTLAPMSSSAIAMDAFGVIVDSNGNLPGCQYIKDINYTEDTPSITASNLGWNPTTTSLTERGTLSASNITLKIETVPVTEEVICAGTPPGNEPDITVTPATVNFGNVNVGGTSDQTVTVKNDGSANLTIGTITSPASPFSKVTDNCSNKTLTPNQTCSVTYRFAPASVNAFNGTSNIPSNDPDENPKIVTLTGNGVQATFGINLLSPSNGHEFWSCYSELPTFQWNKTGTFKSIEVQFSSQNDFSSGLLKAKGSTTTDELQVSSSTWKKVLLLPGKEGGTVYWRVVGKTSEGDEVKSNVFSIEIVEPQPVGNPYLSSTSKSSEPTLYWANQCNIKFKAWFGNDSDFTKSGIKKKALTFNDKNPFDYEGVFFTTLTSGQWNSIKSLVGNAVGVPIYWYVEGWDWVGRHSQTEVISFTLTP